MLAVNKTDYVQALFQRYKNEDGIATAADFPAIYSFAQVFTDNLLLITKKFVYIAFPENVIKYGHPLCSSETTAVPCLTSTACEDVNTVESWTRSKVQNQWSVEPWWRYKKYESLWDQHNH